LNKENKSYELVNFCEFDKDTAQSYCTIHNINAGLNLGDILEVDETKLEDFNWIVGGSPCQSFSIAGKQEGAKWACKDCGEEYNPLKLHYANRNTCPKCGSKNIDKKTTSSLIVEYLRIIQVKKPNVIMFENVKNLVGKKFKGTFDLFYNELNEYGYNCYYKVLNAKDYGVPQNRERIYLIGIKKELDNGKFKFPTEFDNGLRLRDFMNSEVESKYYLSRDKVENMTILPSYQDVSNCFGLKQIGYINGYNGDANRIYSNNCARTLKSEAGGGGAKTGWYMLSNGKVRKLTPKESFRIMGFADDDFNTIRNTLSDNKLYKQAGNSIVVDVLYYIYIELYKAMPYLFNDLKLSSFFSGIGAFEKALDRLYDDINMGKL